MSFFNIPVFVCLDHDDDVDSCVSFVTSSSSGCSSTHEDSYSRWAALDTSTSSTDEDVNTAASYCRRQGPHRPRRSLSLTNTIDALEALTAGSNNPKIPCTSFILETLCVVCLEGMMKRSRRIICVLLYPFGATAFTGSMLLRLRQWSNNRDAIACFIFYRVVSSLSLLRQNTCAS